MVRSTCFLLLLAWIPGAGAQPPAADSVRIGSWNIEHLGDPGARRGSGENVLQKPADLARYIKHLNVDVLAVQEIKADEAAPDGFPKQYRTNSILTKALDELSKAKGQAWKHILFPKMRTADTTQWTGLAWNEAKVKPAGKIFQVPVSHTTSSQGSNRWDRNLHAMMFSAGTGKTDFVMLVVHLKANVQSSYARHREEEIAEFVKKLPELRKAFPKEEDWVLVGDTNILGADEPAVADLVKAGFRELNQADMDTHSAKGIQPFDRAFVPAKQPEFAQAKQEAHVAFQKLERLSFAEYRARYSDHYGITMSLRVMADDD